MIPIINQYTMILIMEAMEVTILATDSLAVAMEVVITVEVTTDSEDQKVPKCVK